MLTQTTYSVHSGTGLTIREVKWFILHRSHQLGLLLFRSRTVNFSLSDGLRYGSLQEEDPSFSTNPLGNTNPSGYSSTPYYQTRIYLEQEYSSIVMYSCLEGGEQRDFLLLRLMSPP